MHNGKSQYNNDNEVNGSGKLNTRGEKDMKRKRLLSVFLVLVMAHSLMTTNVFAGDQKDTFAEGTHTDHCICGVIDCNDNEHGKSLTWTGINSLSEIMEDGNYYLKQDVTLDATWECNYNVNICLDGKTITGAQQEDVIDVVKNKILAITDCQKNVGKITHNDGGRGIFNAGTFTLWSGSISGNRIVGDGAGVLNSGKFTMKGGDISGNKSTCYNGGGVYNSNIGTFIMDGGSIRGNECIYIGGYCYGGGVFNNGEFTMNNGSISGNSAYYGGGVYNNHNDGARRAIFTMTGGVIGGDEDNGNTSQYSGGGVYNLSTFNMSGNAVIMGNKAQESGGGVNNSKWWAIIKLSGNVKITGNTVADNTSNVYIGDRTLIETTGLGADACVGITGQSADQTVVIETASTAGFFSDNADYKLVGREYDNKLVWESNKSDKKDGIGTVMLAGWTYCEEANIPVPDSITNGTRNVRYKYRAKNAADTEPWQDTVPDVAGEYTVKAIFAATSNYKEVITTADFTIAKKKLTIENLKVADKTYDGLATATISGTPTLNGVVNGDDVTLVNGTPSFTSVNAGRDIAINFTDFSLTGIDADNYELIQPTGITASIMEDTTDRTAPVINGAENEKTYCGAVTLTITDNNLDTVTLDGKVVTLTDGKLTLEPKEGKQTVIATDKAGNKTTLTVTVNNGHTGDRAVATENEPVKCIYCGYVIAPALGHSCANHLSYVEAKAATTATEGNIAYWYCAVCDKYFSDENASNEIKKEDTIIAKSTPVIIKGDKATVSAAEKKELSFTSDAIYEDFIRVEVDGKTVDESN